MSGDAKAIETKFFSMGDIGTICFQTLSLQIFQFRNIIFSKKKEGLAGRPLFLQDDNGKDLFRR